MSELTTTRTSRADLHWRLLATVSALALTAIPLSAKAEDADHPTLWIELGGAFDQISHDATGWVPHNLPAPITNVAPEPFGKLPAIGYDFEGAITLQPKGSEWSYTASVRYGRAQRGPKHTHDQTYKQNAKYYLTTYAFLNSTDKSYSSHAIIDFSAGKDIGLGSFHGGKADIHFGVRIAQLNEHAQGFLTAFSTAPKKYAAGKISHEADALFVRSYKGAGPSVSWDSSTPLVATLNDGLSFDWGANAAVLLGQQKASLALHTRNTRFAVNDSSGTVLAQSTAAPVRNRTTVVPNVGGFAGFSWRLPNGKVSLGYRADFFFGAIDGGIATSQKEMRGFYGPFATVSLGIGG